MRSIVEPHIPGSECDWIKSLRTSTLRQSLDTTVKASRHINVNAHDTLKNDTKPSHDSRYGAMDWFMAIVGIVKGPTVTFDVMFAEGARVIGVHRLPRMMLVGR